jgi:hypothetical protein
MGEKYLIVTSNGFGDCMLGLQAARTVQKAGHQVDVICAVRDEVFRPLRYCFGHLFNLSQIPEYYGIDNQILKGPIEEFKEDHKQVFYVLPDLLFRNPYAFNPSLFGSTINLVKRERLLSGSVKNNQIYLGLISTTPRNVYHYREELALELARRLPNCIIHLPILDVWANVKMDTQKHLDIQFPDNVKVYKNPDFVEQINIQKGCGYGVYVDNGPSHLAYHFGQDRLLLDPSYGMNPNVLAWVARWRETIEDSIPLNTAPANVAKVVKTNLEIPETTLLPKDVVLCHRDEPPTLWPQSLIFKY